MKFQSPRAATSALLGLLLAGTMLAAPSFAQTNSPTAAAKAAALSPWPIEINTGAVQADAWYDNYKFRDGETLARLKIHYQTLGTPHRDAQGNIDNAVLVLHWTGADSRAVLSPIYMKALFDPGRPLDAKRYYLIFPDNVGHGQSSKPSDGLRTKFPNYGYDDIVDLQHRLVTETLGIKHLHAILGMSMGGMNAWQWAEAYPDMMDGVMPVVSMPVPVSGRNLLWRRIVIDTIRSDPGYDKGNYTKNPTDWYLGLAVLRMMIDSPPHLQDEIPNGAAAATFLNSTLAVAAHIDANNILYSLKSSADYNPEPGLSSITTKVFALDFSDDQFNPQDLHVLDTLVPKLKQGRYVMQAGTPTSPGHLTMSRPDLWANQVGVFMHWLGDAPPDASK